jgi:hypothetical protein
MSRLDPISLPRPAAPSSLAPSRSPALFALVILWPLLAAGCGAEPPASTPPASMPPATTPPAPSCDSLLAECLAKQQSCVDGSDGARCEPCAVGAYAAASGSCEAIGGTPVPHEFAEFTVDPGQEILGLCQSWTLNNATELWVNAVELAQDVASHHSNWTFVPADKFDGPDGVWSCSDRNYSQLTAALLGGVLYAQSTQAEKEVQKFPDGAAVRIPPYARIIGDVHLLNTTDKAITGHVRMNLYTLPVDQVTVKLVPFHLTYEGLDIPPHATSRFTGECAVESQFPSGFAMQVYYALPHTHSLATRFFLSVLGGPRDGESLLDIEGFTPDAHGRAYDPPIDMKDAAGFRFGCEYTNPRAESVGWGFGDQEMCEVLGFADSTMAFESSVGEAQPDGTDGQVQLFTGACSTLAFPWDFNKPGGPPPP